MSLGDPTAPLLRVVIDGDIEAGRASREPSPPPKAGFLSRISYSEPIALLAQHKKSPTEIEELLIGTSRSRRAALEDYYLQQNDHIDSLLQTQEIHRGLYTNDREEEDATAQRALNLSFAANCVLLVVRVGIAIISGSLSLYTATIDAVLDVISSAMLYWTSWQSKRENKYLYPVGKERMEPLGATAAAASAFILVYWCHILPHSAVHALAINAGVIVFSTIMATACFSVILESVKALISPPEAEGLPTQQLWLITGATIFVVVMKLSLYLYCKGSLNPAVRAFALDHLNDVLVNGVGLAGALLGARVAPFWDPTIAILLSLWVMWAWGGQAREHIMNLVGLSAPPELLQKLTYLAFYHDQQVKQIDTVRAFSYGSTFIAEVDIVLPEEMPLKEAHDIGESLQSKLELLPEVARAYVHLDWESTHAPEH